MNKKTADKTILEPDDNFPVNEPVLLDYQIRSFKSTADVVIEEKSRRVGITWGIAAKNAVTAAKPKNRGGRNVFYIGTTQKMAAEYIQAVTLFAKAFNQVALAIEEGLFSDEDGNKDILTYIVRFPNSGFKITALSSSPANLRGMQGDVVLDEFAFHKNPGELLKAAVPLLMWGAKIHIISTHNGVDNAFNQLINDVRAGRFNYVVHRTTLDDALADGLYKRICYVTGQKWTQENEQAWCHSLIKNLPKEAADEEFFCIPSQSGGAYLSRIIIENAMIDAPVIRYTGTAEFNALPEHIRMAEINDWCEAELKPLLADLNPLLQHCLGEDFARSGDLTVMLPMAIEQNLDRTVPFIVELKNLPFKNQEQILYYLIDRLPRFSAAALDARGNGQYLAEQAGYKYGSCISQVMLTQAFYLENFPKLKAAFEDMKLRIPKDADVLNDLRAVQLVGGIPKVPDVKTGEQKDRHGDTAIALLMAWFASLMDFIEYRYIPVKTSLKPDADRLQRSVRSNNGGFANSKGHW